MDSIFDTIGLNFYPKNVQESAEVTETLAYFALIEINSNSISQRLIEIDYTFYVEYRGILPMNMIINFGRLSIKSV